MKSVIVLLLVLGVVLIACTGANEPGEEPELAASSPEMPTATPFSEPTVTQSPEPTATLKPQPTAAETPQPAATVEKEPTSSVTEARPDDSTYMLPNWVSLNLPEDWHVLRAQAPGQIAMSNKDQDFPYFTLEAGDALLMLFEYGDESVLPLELLADSYLENLGPDRVIIADVKETEVNGLTAAMAKYTSPQPSGTAVEYVTIVQGADCTIAFLAIGLEDDFEELAPIFDDILDSLQLHSAHPAPAIGDPDKIPDHYQTYSDDDLQLELRHPPGWKSEKVMGSLLLLSPDIQERGLAATDSVIDSVMFMELDSLAPISNPDADLEGWFGELFTMAGWMIVHDAQLVSELSTVEVEGQSTIAGIVSATDEGEPIQGILAVTVLDDRVIATIAWMRDLTSHLGDLQNIISSLILKPVTYSPTSDVQSIEPGQILSGQWTADGPGEFTVTAEAGVPFYFYVVPEGEMNVAELSVYDPAGHRVHMNPYASPVLGPSVDAILPDTTGEYTIAVNSAFADMSPGSTGAFIIHLLDTGNDSDSLLAAVEEELAGGESVEHAVDARAGEPLVAYAEPTGANAGNTNLVLEFVDESGERLLERHNHSTDGMPVTLYYLPEEDSKITLHLSELEGRPASYRLVFVHGE